MRKTNQDPSKHSDRMDALYSYLNVIAELTEEVPSTPPVDMQWFWEEHNTERGLWHIELNADD